MEKNASGSATHYKELLVWQKGMALATAIYELTARFPADERFGLTSQMRRAAVSVPSNIAELRTIVDRAAERFAWPGQPRAETAARREVRLRGRGRQQPEDARGDRQAQEHRPDQRDRPDPGRNRHRQGTGRQGHSQQQPAQEQALRGHELHRPEREPARRRTVRPRGRARSPAPTGCARAASSTPTAARCFSTKSATCR